MLLDGTREVGVVLQPKAKGLWTFDRRRLYSVASGGSKPSMAAPGGMVSASGS